MSGGLLEKAQIPFKCSRATETANIQNFDMLKQSFTGEIKFANKEAALIQTSNDDDSQGAPNPAAYGNQSGGFICTVNEYIQQAPGLRNSSQGVLLVTGHIKPQPRSWSTFSRQQ